MILRWTLNGLLQARARVLGSAAAIAAAFVLVLVFKAVWQGETNQLAVYLERAGADVWVMQAHVSNMHMATSFLSEGKRYEVENVEGVESVSGILYVNRFVGIGDRKWFSYVVGLDEPRQMGGPWKMSKGKNTVSPGEAIIPEVLSRVTGVGVGDQVTIAARLFSVVGLSSDTFSVVNPITFVHASDLAELLSLRDYDSYLLVRAEPGVAPTTLAKKIRESVNDVEALPTPEFVENDLALASQMGTEVIAILTMICATLAAFLVTFALFIHTSRMRRDLAILKALGFRKHHLYASVLLQSTLLTTVAFVIGTVVAGLFAILGPRILPVLSMSITPDALLQIGVAGLIVAILPALLLARRVGNVDPLTVFHS